MQRMRECPFRAMAVHTYPEPLAGLAIWKCSSSMPKNVMWQHTPIFSCKGSYEFSSHLLSWSNALRLFCSKHEIMVHAECWKDVRSLRGWIPGQGHDSPILRCFVFFLNLFHQADSHSENTSSSLLHFLFWERKMDGKKIERLSILTLLKHPSFWWRSLILVPSLPMFCTNLNSLLLLLKATS